MARKILSLILCFSLLYCQTGFAQVAGELDISGYIGKLGSSFAVDKFRPLHLRYFSYDISNNNFRILLDKGDLRDLKGPELESSSHTLLDYFLIGVTLPDKDFWVNLRPDSEDSIIEAELARTDVGKILLEADLQLKKDTARFTSPETPEGRAYWDKLYRKAGELFGSENLTIPTLTRPWIVPNEVIVRETKDSAYVYKATLKVMLEQDHLKNSTVYNFKDPRLKTLNEYSSQLIRETIIPKLTKEVNVSKRYASLRQVFYSLILARWFKSRFYGKGGLYPNLIDKGDLNGLTSREKWSKTTYFKQYQKSFQEGEYNVQEPAYTPFGQTIRTYFSGGFDLTLPYDRIIETGKSGQYAGSPVTDVVGAVLRGVRGATGFTGNGRAGTLEEVSATAGSPVEFINAQIEKLGAIKWTKKISYSPENEQKAKASIEDKGGIREKLTELLELVYANESLRTQENKILRAVEIVFDEQGKNLRADVKLYPIHPLQAALNFIKKLGISDPDFIESAILHDTVEDVEKYTNSPDLIGETFGKTVQRNVQSVTNKGLPGGQKDFLRRFLAGTLQLDPESKALLAIMNILEYQVGVIREVSGNPVTLLLKSVDFSDNALTQKNLSPNPKLQKSEPSKYETQLQLQSRLSSKYRDLLNIFAEEFEALAEAEAAKGTKRNDTLVNGLQGNAADYRAVYKELEGYSGNWEYAPLHNKALAAIDVRFGGLRGLEKELARSSSPLNIQEMLNFADTLGKDYAQEAAAIRATAVVNPGRVAGIIAEILSEQRSSFIKSQSTEGKFSDADAMAEGIDLAINYWKGVAGSSLLGSSPIDTLNEAKETLAKNAHNAWRAGVIAKAGETVLDQENKLVTPRGRASEGADWDQQKKTEISAGQYVDVTLDLTAKQQEALKGGKLLKMNDGPYVINMTDGTIQLDTLNTPYEALSPAWKGKNSAAVEAAAGYYQDALSRGFEVKELQTGLADAIEHGKSGQQLDAAYVAGDALKQYIVEVGNTEHKRWMDANAWMNEKGDNPLFISFDKLPSEQQYKDLEGLKQLVDYIAASSAITPFDIPKIITAIEELRGRNFDYDQRTAMQNTIERALQDPGIEKVARFGFIIVGVKYMPGEGVLYYTGRDGGLIGKIKVEPINKTAASPISDELKDKIRKGLPGYDITIQDVGNGNVEIKITVPVDGVFSKEAFSAKRTISTSDGTFMKFMERFAYDLSYIDSNGYDTSEYGMAKVTAKKSIIQFAKYLLSVNAGGAASPVRNELGGIDFRTMNMIIQPMGSFSGLNFTLPKLSNVYKIDLDKEFADIQRMVQKGIIPSGSRLKEFLAACYQKKEIGKRMDGMIVCLVDIFRLEEENLVESTPELKESLVILDSNRFVLR